MGIGKGLAGLRLLAILGIVAVPTSALAHAHLTDPPSRPGTNDTTIKIAECGGLPRSGSFVQYDPGATITVKFKETVGHVGCYQVKLGDKDDSNWVTLTQINDPAGNQGDQQTSVKLPDGFMCESCTLQLRQLMNDGAGNPACAADAGTASSGIYYSCADIRIGDFPDAAPSADAGTEDEDGGSSSGGPTTVPTDGGGRTTEDNGTSPSRNLRAGAGDDGCNVGWGAPGGASLLASVGIGALAVLRRRRRSK